MTSEEKKVLGRKGFTARTVAFRTGKRDKDTGKPQFEYHIVKDFCGKRTF